MPFLTVFTPAYNRAYTLPRTYESLKSQKCKDFVWLIVDDGSTDNTKELISNWQKEDNGFEIRYVYKENGGMHTAHNTAYENIDTELNVCIDSDDALADNAVELIKIKWNSTDKEKYAGILGLDADFEGNIIGKGFPEGLEETTLGDYYKNGGKGDKKLVLRTDVVHKYPPYPTFPGEKFTPLGILYTMIDKNYKLCVLDKVLCNVEYMPDGSTHNMIRQYYRNPNGFRYSRILCMPNPRPFKKTFILYTHYVAESLLSKKPIFKDAFKKTNAFVAFPFGLILYILILIKNRRN